MGGGVLNYKVKETEKQKFFQPDLLSVQQTHQVSLSR